MNELLVDKYKPKKFEDIISLPKTIPETIERDGLHHMVFYGSPGNGKTTTAHVIARHLNAEVLEINVSDNTGIDTLRDTIKPFANKSVTNGVKIVILDEFDGATIQLQKGLRGLIVNSKNTRFIITMNDYSKLHDAIESRMVHKYNFQLKPEDIKKKLKYICDQENISCDDSALDEIIKSYKYDVRAMINFLQQNMFEHIDVNLVDSYQINAKKVVLIIKNNSWFDARSELLKYSIQYERMLSDIDKLYFYHPKADETKKRQVNAICCRFQHMMSHAFDKEQIFAEFISEFKMIME